MNGLDDEFPMWIQKTLWQYDTSDLQLGHANPGSLESELVSGKMKEAVICTIVIQAQ